MLLIDRHDSHFNPIQLIVEPHPLQPVGLCSLTPTQQKAQWWCFSVTQGFPQGERWQQSVGVMASGAPTQVSPVALDPRRLSHRHPQSHLHRHQCLLRLLLPLVRMNFWYYYRFEHRDWQNMLLPSILFYYFSKFYLLFSLTLPIILTKNSKLLENVYKT